MRCSTRRMVQWGAFPVCPAFFIIAEAVWLFETCSAKEPAYNVRDTSGQFQNQSQKVYIAAAHYDIGTNGECSPP